MRANIIGKMPKLLGNTSIPTCEFLRIIQHSIVHEFYCHLGSTLIDVARNML